MIKVCFLKHNKNKYECNISVVSQYQNLLLSIGESILLPFRSTWSQWGFDPNSRIEELHQSVN